MWYHSVTAGLFFSNGNVWRRQRRFAMATLRTFGLAKSSIEQSICEESHHLLEAMGKEKGWQRTLNKKSKMEKENTRTRNISSFSGEPFDPVPLLNNVVANIICQIVFGRRFDYQDQTLQSMLTNLTAMAYLEGSIWALVRGHTHSQHPHMPAAEFRFSDSQFNILTMIYIPIKYFS